VKLAAILTLAAILVFWLRRRDFIEPLPNVFEDDVDWLREFGCEFEQATGTNVWCRTHRLWGADHDPAELARIATFVHERGLI
jgi:hypothetical protein